MPSTTTTTDSPVTAIPSSGVTRGCGQRKVLENRDLCRIVSCYIPNYLDRSPVDYDDYGGGEDEEEEDEEENEDDEDEDEDEDSLKD